MDNKSAGRQSMSSHKGAGVESDTDSMAEYGEGDTGNGCALNSHLFSHFLPSIFFFQSYITKNSASRVFFLNFVNWTEND